MPDHSPNAEIIICVHNALEEVRRCLTSVVAHTDARHRLILVDDASAPECQAELVRFNVRQPPTILLRNDERRGYTRAANRGLRASRAELVVLLNSDTIVTPFWLERLWECAASDPRIGIVGPLSNAATFQSVPERYDHHREWSSNALPQGWLPDDVAAAVASIAPRTFPRVGILNGFCLAIKREVIDAVGYFDELSFPDGYGEEQDYGFRARKAGFELAVADHAYVFHSGTASYQPETRDALKLSSRAAQLRKHKAKQIRSAIAMTYHEPTLAMMRQSLATLFDSVTPFLAPDLTHQIKANGSIPRRNQGKPRSQRETDGARSLAPITPIAERLHAAGSPPDGLNVAGYFRLESGVGAATRGYVAALQQLGTPLALHDLSHLSGISARDSTIGAIDSEQKFDINLICANAHQVPRVFNALGETYFKHHHNIGIWHWELPSFPARWQNRFDRFDEIWVGSSFVANALAPVSPVPVFRLPPVMTPAVKGSRTAGRQRLGLSDDEFLFLVIFSFRSYFERKNPLAVIAAFARAFSTTDPVRLVIKCTEETADPPNFAAMQAAAQNHRVTIHTGYWSAPQMRDLMAACDAYVSLHRAEGIGLPLAEAMALGIPTVATAWSGNRDFMDVSNSFPVRFRLVALQENIGPYRAGEIWAEPSVEHAAEQMRRIYDEPADAHRRGQAAQADIAMNYSPQAVARIIGQRLDAIKDDRSATLLRQTSRRR